MKPSGVEASRFGFKSRIPAPGQKKATTPVEPEKVIEENIENSAKPTKPFPQN
jgi:hypothetical protein